MSSMEAMAALGIWPALPITGYWLLRPRTPDLDELPAVALLAIATTIGIAVWSIPLLLSAVSGLYHAEVWGVLGWIVVLIALGSLPRAHWLNNRPRFAIPKWDGMLALGLAAGGILYMSFPTDSIWGFRDFGIYTNHAIWIARHGSLDVPYPWTADAAGVFSESFMPFPGLYPTQPTMTVQFGHLFPVWLAQAYSTIGYSGLQRLNPAFSLLSLATFYGLGRSVLPGSYSVVATLFLAFNPSQIWLARITLTEILTQLLIWAGMTLLLLAIRSEGAIYARWAGLLLGLSALVRIDSLILVPLLLLAHLFVRIAGRSDQRSSRVWLGLYQTSLPVFALAVGYYAVYSRPYFEYLLPQLSRIATLAIVCLAVLLASMTRIASLATPIVRSRLFLTVFGVSLLAVYAYAYWVRPYAFPYELYSGTGTGFDGTRTYTEDSLINLAKYLSPPVVWAAVLGWLLAVWRILRTGRYLELAVVTVVGGGVSAMYLWNQSITPDHFWAIRRYVPVIIPSMVLFSALCLWWALRAVPGRWRAVLSSATLTFLALFTAQVAAAVVAHTERKGLYEQLAELSEKLPEDEVIVTNSGGRWTTPLYLAFDRRVVPINGRGKDGRLAFEDWLQSQLTEGGEVFFATDDEFQEKWLEGLEYSKLTSTTLTQSYLERIPNPLPRDVVKSEVIVNAYKITGINASYVNRDIGGEHAWLVKESGFYSASLRGDGNYVRWTNGAASLTIPMAGQPRPESLRVAIYTGPGSVRHLRVLANGQELFDGRVAGRKRWSRTFSLAGVSLGNELTIEVLSDTFLPQGLQAGSEPLVRGVLVRDLVLLTD